ncbi:MAG: hypothetical protein A2Y95_03705 [Deltaproteobacteria bacterium RBG_13_65_10]|nr:MAG: hypothetical protein A2Y95_03705 [Deltaproteobacteria bacterium RBG_13_65_10]
MREPDGSVVSESQGDVTHVMAAITRVNLPSLFVKVDGVDILAGLGINPATQFPGGPYSGDVTIDGQIVHVSDLVVEAGALDSLSSNTLRMTLENLGAGGHIFVVNGSATPGSIPVKPARECVIDDLKDKATSSVFGVKITSPTEGEETSTVPTPVTGEVRGGRMIVSTKLNGKDIDVSGQVFTPGDGENSADEVVLPINTALDQTNLANDIATGNGPVGTLDPGSNRLVADAMDDLGNRAFATRVFAVGPVQSIGQAASASQAFQGQVQAIAQATAVGSLQNALTSTEIPNAFVLGMKPAAIQAFFQETCNQALPTAEQKIHDALVGFVTPNKTVNGGVSCNPHNVHATVTDVQFSGGMTCNVSLAAGQINIAVGLPTYIVFAHITGHCETDVLGVCISETVINTDIKYTQSGSSLAFPITEAQFTAGGSSTGSFNFGPPAAVQVLHDGNEINCLAGFLADLINAVVFVFTFGQVDFDVTPNLEGKLFEVDLQDKVGVQTFPVEIKQIKPNEQTIAQFMLKLTSQLDTVNISPSGFVMSIKATISSTSTDPEIATTPGAVLVNPATPSVPEPNTGNTYFVANADALNQLFAGMTTQGELKTICKPSGKTVADLLPADCDTLTADTPAATAVLIGGCHGAKGDDCTVLPLGQRLACAATKQGLGNINISGSTKILFCGRTDVPPRLLLQDNPVTAPVESFLRINDLLVGAVLDRDGNDAINGELNAVPKCFMTGAPTTGDCKVAAVCLDLNFPTNLVLDTTGGKLKLTPQVQGVQTLTRPEGAVCDGGTNFGGDGNLLSSASSSDPINDVMMSVDTLTPPIQSDGLDLGGIVTFSAPKLVTIDKGGDPAFQEYVGLTGDIIP